MIARVKPDTYPKLDPIAETEVPTRIRNLKRYKVYFILREDYVFWVDGTMYVIQEGFITDLNSDPAIAQLILPKDNFKNIAAAVIHDFLQETGVLGSRKKTDQAYKEFLRLFGAGPIERTIRYAGVRAGGWRSWRRYRRKQETSKITTAVALTEKQHDEL